jgi:tyrosyl-tRNA synthetase
MNEILERGVDEIIEQDHLKKRLQNGDKLRVKLGIDPTAKDLHLGHTVVLRKLRQFQDAGHQAVFIIGDFTALIGDPSGRSDLRPVLTSEQIKENLKNYLKEAGKVINIKKAEVRYNSEWLAGQGPGFIMELASKFTVARMLERDDFQKRIKNDQDVGVLEIMYPILQGYDSVAVKADVELGGTDQKFNLLMGRKVQKRYGQPEQDILTCPLIEGLDGVRKMSKSLGNYVGLSDKPADMFGKIMSVPDSLMVKYFTLLTDVPIDEIEQLKKEREILGTTPTRSPKEWKEKLAHELVRIYHSPQDADKALAEFDKVFSRRESPTEMPEFSGSGTMLLEFLTKHGFAKSKTEGKTLFDQGAIKINNEVAGVNTSWNYELKSGDTIQVGSHRFAKIK